MKAITRGQRRVAPRPKQCPLCRKPVTKADFDTMKATYANVARRKELGLRWQHLDCRQNRRHAKRLGSRRVKDSPI
jgi:hypothetical protein